MPTNDHKTLVAGQQESGPGPWWKRLAWFVGLWVAGVLAVGSVAYLIRLWLL